MMIRKKSLKFTEYIMIYFFLFLSSITFVVKIRMLQCWYSNII